MSVKYAICVFVTLAVVGPVHLDDSVAQNEIADTSYSERDPLNMGERNVNNQNLDYFGNNNQLIGNNNVGGSWLASARDALSGPAGQIVVHMAKEMISRSTGNSQVLSLNLTNLLILILLKALIFAAGLIGAGTWGQYARARSFESPFINEDEAPLFLGYLALEGSGQDGCLSRAACQSPETANEYVKAARAILKGAEMFDNHYFNSTNDYAYTLNQLDQSIHKGMQGAPCDSIYHCHL